MKITIQPDGTHWLVLIEGQPRREFGSKAAAWAFVMGITSANIVSVVAYDANGTKQAEVTLNASAKV